MEVGGANRVGGLLADAMGGRPVELEGSLGRVVEIRISGVLVRSGDELEFGITSKSSQISPPPAHVDPPATISNGNPSSETSCSPSSHTNTCR